MKPDEWLCAALSVGAASKNFVVTAIDDESGPRGEVMVRVLHKESGALWSFRCKVDREGAT